MNSFDTSDPRQRSKNSRPPRDNLRTILAKSYQEKERHGSLTENDIARLRALQKTFNAHPATLRYARAQQDLITLLQDCNGAISADLGFDFAATAAPAATC